MGSTDLLKLVKSVNQPVHIKEYAGKTVAVDGRVLLSQQHEQLTLLENNDKIDEDPQNNNDDKKTENPNDESTQTTNTKTTQSSLLDILRSNDVTPLVIVEGKRLSYDQKKAKGDDDKVNEKNNQKKENVDNDIDVLLKQLKKEKIEYIQAPYESKAQIAYLMETKRVEACLVDENDLEILAFGCQQVLFLNQQEGNTTTITRLRFSDLALTKEIELRDWSSKSIQELCFLFVVMNDCAKNPISLERTHSFFVNNKKNSRLALRACVENNKDVEKIHRQMSARWSQKVYDERLKQYVPWHKDPALKTKNNKAASSSSDNKTVKTIRLHQDNKENIPPWMTRTIQEATVQPVHRDNPEPPQQAPKVAVEQKKVVPLSKKDNQKNTEDQLIHTSKWSKTKTSTLTKTATSSPLISTSTLLHHKKIDKKRKSLDGLDENVDNENSPLHENNTNISNKKRGSQSLPSRRRLGLSDNSNRRTLF